MRRGLTLKCNATRRKKKTVNEELSLSSETEKESLSEAAAAAELQQQEEEELQKAIEAVEKEYIALTEEENAPQYISYIDPETGQVSPVEGDRTSFSPFLMAAAMDKKGIYYPEVAVVSPSVRAKPPAIASGLTEFDAGDESNPYEETEEQDEALQSSERRYVTYVDKESSEKQSSATPAAPSTPFSASAAENKKGRKARKPKSGVKEDNPVSQSPAQSSWKSKWTPPPPKGDGLLPGLRETNSIIKALWAERGARGEPFVVGGKDTDYSESNDEMWIHQRGPKMRADHERKYKHPASSEAALVSAAADFGQIRLYGSEPTVTESMLGRARREALKEERLMIEEELKERLGPLGYLKQFVSAYPRDTSKEAVAARVAEGVSVEQQISEMLRYQTTEEYRVMTGTDARVRRDPIEYRMTTKQAQKVWGGDPVMRSESYYRDKNEVLDFRGPGFHEPTKAPFDYVIESGRAVTREELEIIFEKERLMNAKNNGVEDAAETVDITEEEDEEEEVIMLDEGLDDEEDEEEVVEVESGADEDEESVVINSPRLKFMGPLGGEQGEPNLKLVNSMDVDESVEVKKVSGANESSAGTGEESKEDEEDDWFDDFQDFISQSGKSNRGVKGKTGDGVQPVKDDDDWGDDVVATRSSK